MAADTEEVRVAMALNGGVSLAIWMGGCGVELDAALCDAFDRELVVDLMSGASAGGINGALLGAAIVWGKPLTPTFIRKQWLDLGDIDKLLQPADGAAPESLMRGGFFLEELRKTFRALKAAEGGDDPPPPRHVKLDITTTDIVGTVVELSDDWGNPLRAAEHRARFRFHHDRDYDPELLAEASRCSASFPLAFEPVKVSRDTRRLAGFTDPRYVIDGGLLNNAPISVVVDEIPFQQAACQVKRVLVYLNADAPKLAEADGKAPTAAAIAGNVLNLPRQAPFVDQLYAIERATERAQAAPEEPAMALLKVHQQTLEKTAKALLPAYRRRRLEQSLVEILGSVKAAREEADAWGEGVELPWIPRYLHPLGPDRKWQWGVRPAQRALHLLLDAIRWAAVHADARERRALFAARGAVYTQLATLEGEHSTLAASTRVRDAIRRGNETSDTVVPVITAAVDAVLPVRDVLGQSVGDALFGKEGKPVDWFLRRALAIEVVRRALDAERDIEPAQRLSFVQLTPFVPALLFATHPLTGNPWSTPEEKLLGIRLGHFAGFYRRSWRANDFMWGRLDAAARIVDLLVSTERAEQLVGDPTSGSSPPWELLASSLWSDDEREQQLIGEALRDLPPDYPACPATRDGLARALAHDLRIGDGGLTRAVCTRAAQLEIFRDEWGYVDAAASSDAALGAGTPALGLGGAEAALDRLREEDAPTLPSRLAARDEIASSLALGLSARAGLVALAGLRAAGRIGEPFFALRAVLLPVAGGVARQVAPRLAVVAAFAAAALFLAGRSLQTGGEPQLDGAWAASLLVAVFAVLTVSGVVFVPALRGLKMQAAGRKAEELGWALALAAAGIAGPLAAVAHAPSQWPDVVAALGAEEVWGPILALTTAFVLGTPIAWLPALVSPTVDRLLIRSWAGTAGYVLTFVTTLALGGASLQWVIPALGDGTWQTLGAAGALLAGPLLAARLFLRRP